MINYWLERKPRILQLLDVSLPSFYGKWYVLKVIEDDLYDLYIRRWGTGGELPHLYLHPDGLWRTTTYNLETRQYSGYYDSITEAEAALKYFVNNDFDEYFI